MQPDLRSLSRSAVVLLGGLLVLGPAARGQVCSYSELNGGLLGVTGTSQGQSRASVVHDFGQGPTLFVTGGFSFAGGQPANNIAAWDGSAWTPLGLGISGTGTSLVVFDDGSGPQVYVGGFHSSAGGEFSDPTGKQMRHLARWNGSQWSGLAGGAPNGEVHSLAVHDDGSGQALYASGDFTSVGGKSASRIAKWNGTSWSALGSGLNSRAWTMTTFDAGDGSMLWAGGDFTLAGGVSVRRAARWNGTAWVDAYMGTAGFGAVRSFAEYQGDLYAGGSFSFIYGGTTNFRNLARLSGSTWIPVGGGVDNGVMSLLVHDNGDGEALYVGGDFDKVGPIENEVDIQRVARRFAGQWEAIADTSGQQPFVGVIHLGEFAQGGTTKMILGGFFQTWNGAVVNGIVEWDCGAPSAPALETLAGCFGNPAQLSAPNGPAAVGQPFGLSLNAAGFASGLAVFFVGLDGRDGSGCGLLLPTLGELLLAAVPAPAQVGVLALSGASATLALPVPNWPSLVGDELVFQGTAIGLSTPGFPAEFSNGLLVRVQP